MTSIQSLADAPSDLLEKLSFHAGSGDLPQQWNLSALSVLQLQDLWPAMVPFQGTKPSILVAIVAVMLEERSRHRRPPPALVWTGAELKNSNPRDTSMVIEELLSSATKEVMIAGYAFDHGHALFNSLRKRMQTDKIECNLVMDVRPPRTSQSLEIHLAGVLYNFQAKLWPGGKPWPNLYFDPLTCKEGSRLSMHAKCIVVDDQRALIGSANFTDRGRKRNTELGILVEDKAIAGLVLQQWKRLIAEGLLCPLT